MPMVFVNEYLPTLMGYWLGLTSNVFFPWQLVLFQNDLTPDQDTVYADLTLASFGGYGPVTIVPSGWTTPTIVSGSAVSTYTATPQTWTATTTGETVYGAALVTPTSPKIVAIERWADSVDIVSGGVLGYLPQLTFGTNLCP